MLSNSSVSGGLTLNIVLLVICTQNTRSKAFTYACSERRVMLFPSPESQVFMPLTSGEHNIQEDVVGVTALYVLLLCYHSARLL